MTTTHDGAATPDPVHDPRYRAQLALDRATDALTHAELAVADGRWERVEQWAVALRLAAVELHGLAVAAAVVAHGHLPDGVPDNPQAA